MLEMLDALLQEIGSIRGKNTVASHLIPSSLFSEAVRYTVTCVT